MTNLLSVLTLLAVLSPPDCHPSDLHRFPPPWVVHVQLDFAREAVAHADRQLAFYPGRHPRADYWRDRRIRLWQIHEAWDWLRLAQWNCYAGADRCFLRNLRAQIGPDAYVAGVMPRPR